MSEMEEIVRQLREANERLREENERLKNDFLPLKQFLHDCHTLIFASLRIADKNKWSTGETKVDGKFYPKILQPWSGFDADQRGRFEMITHVLGENPLFVPVRHTSRWLNPKPVAVEKDIDRFEHMGVETPAQAILNHVLANPDVCKELDVSSLVLTNNARELQGPDDAVDDAGSSDDPGHARPKKRIATEHKVSRLTYPDGEGIRRSLQGEESLAFVFDYKAAHRLVPEDVRLALGDDMFLSNVIRQVLSNKEPREEEERHIIRTNRQIAMALTQVYDYMITRGLAYGYVTAGKVLIFLHVKPEDLQTLFYHLCVPDADTILPNDKKADGSGAEIDLSQTAVAQLACFCLLTLRSKARQGPAIDESLGEQTAAGKLRVWPNPYVSEDGNDATDDGKKYSGHSVRLDPSGESAPGSFGSGGSQSDMYECIPPTRPYCTQACLLGLKRGGDLDENCPNVSAHRTDNNSQRHAISADKLTALVAEQLRRSPYRYCEAVDPCGLKGKIGRIGALFRLEVPPYGYSFVAKGVQSAHVHHLLHESRVYARLDRLQGVVVPVHLGVVDVALPRGYYMSGGARVTNMMLLSWAGELSADVGTSAAVPDMVAEEQRSSREVEREGVIQGDLRSPNMLWNEECGRVMVIDFDAAQFLPAAKHKRLEALSAVGGSKKRTRQDRPQKDVRKRERRAI